MNLKYEYGNLRLSDIVADNIFDWNGESHELKYLFEGFEGNKGGNSSVFKIVNTNDEADISIIKFSKYPLKKDNTTRNDRFEREITALKNAFENGFENVIKIKDEGIYLHRVAQGNSLKFRYYIMEKAECDLTEFVKNTENAITIADKVALCRNILNGISELHRLGIYHRDIKPDNIFLTFDGNSRVWKIGDLGLIANRGEDLAHETGKKIGPANWLSPEAMNKVLCEGTTWELNFDTEITEKSDVFQLGSVLWYIFNHNAPIGQVTIGDFYIKDYVIFSLLFTMLRHKKSTRKDLYFYEQHFAKLDNLYLSNQRRNSSRWLTRKCKKILN